jgi:Tfp pilus assembly protein PilN
MRPVNLLPPEKRPRVAGEGDPRVAWAILGVLGLILLAVVVSISMANRAKTLDNEATAMQVEADRITQQIALIPKGPDAVTQQVKSRTLLVGGLAAVRFPWDTMMHDLTQALPPDVTIDTIATVTAGTNPDAALSGTSSSAPTMTLNGCVSGWVGYSRLLTWLKQMRNVAAVKSNSSAITTAAAEGDDGSAPRTQNCGPRPLQFSLLVAYRLKQADFKGLPRVESQNASTAGGATGTAAAATTAGTGG